MISFDFNLATKVANLATLHSIAVIDQNIYLIYIYIYIYTVSTNWRAKSLISNARYALTLSLGTRYIISNETSQQVLSIGNKH